MSDDPVMDSLNVWVAKATQVYRIKKTLSWGIDNREALTNGVMAGLA
jgi:hypothetical protein